MSTFEEGKWKCFRTKIKEALKYKSHTLIGEIFQSKRTMVGLVWRKKRMLLPNGNFCFYSGLLSLWNTTNNDIA